MSKLVVGLFEMLARNPLGSLLCHAIEGNVLTEVLAQKPELVLWVLMEHMSILGPSFSVRTDDVVFVFVGWRTAPHWHELKPCTVHGRSAVLPAGQLLAMEHGVIVFGVSQKKPTGHGLSAPLPAGR